MSLLNNIVAYYKLDNNVTDSHSSNNLTAVNLTYTTGKLLTAGSFNGSTKYAYIGGKLLTASSGTVTCWINTGSFANPGRILGYGGDGTGAVLALEVRGSQLSITTRDSGSTFLNLIVRTALLSINTWYHVAFISTGSVYRIIVNGVESGYTISAGANNGKWADIITTTNADTSIGALKNNGTYGHYFNGIIDEVGVWNRALTLLEVQELYNNGNGLTYPFAKSNMFLMF